MYEKLKSIAKQILPVSFLKKNEDILRKMISLKYKGNNYECNICDFKMSSFVELEINEKLCPRCGSLPRTRRLWKILSKKKLLDNRKILHFSPPKSLAGKIKKINNALYITTDFEGEFQADKQLNIEAINEPDNSYDLIICYHVLEHIINDKKAMEELFRILKKNGYCIIQTPFKDGEIYENFEIKTRQERLAHFGQEDHVRIYSAQGLKNRLSDTGFDVEIFSFKEDAENRNGFNLNERVLLAKKI